MRKIILFLLLLLLAHTNTIAHPIYSKAQNRIDNTPPILKATQTNAARQLCSPYKTRAELID